MIRGAENRPLSGLALLRKPAGLTSFQALYPLKRALGSGKVGHAGTLDRFASGLLIALTGSYSRLVPYVVAGEKRYRGLIAFGAETDTLDPEGKVIAQGPIPSHEELLAALPRFLGTIGQVPPAYSAIHVGGKRAYQIALGGETPAMKERQVEIFALELLSYEGGQALVDLRCSSGTYVRSLARDIALQCGSRAHLRALERLSIGPFRVDEAALPDRFDPEKDLRALGPEDALALGLGALALRDEGRAAVFRNGGRLAADSFVPLAPPRTAPTNVAPRRAASEESSSEPRNAPGRESAVFGPGGELLGVVLLGSEGPSYRVVLPRPAALPPEAGS